MIEINLLPEELKKTKKEAPFSLPAGVDLDAVKKKALWLFAGLLVFIAVLPAGGIFIRDSQMKMMARKEKKILPKVSELQKLNEETSVLKTRASIINELTKRRFLWAQKLNELSDLTLPCLWFTRIYTDGSSGLVIEGSVVSANEEEMANVGKFIKAIKEDDEFFKYFKNIKLETVQRKTKYTTDVVDFKIALFL